METDKYCSSVVHLLRGRELGFRNLFTDNIRQCSKHKRWQTRESHNVYDNHFNECRLLFFVTCQGAIRAIVDELYNETVTHAHQSLQGLYTLDVLKLTNDIYIEMRDVIEGDLKMVIDARKIISNLKVSLEDEEWETLENVKWGPLIRETYGDVMDEVGKFTHSAALEMKNKTTEDMWEGWHRLKRDVWNYYYLSYSEEFEPILLPRLCFVNEVL